MSNPVSGTRFCANCGRSLEPADRFCVACGVSVPQPALYPPAPTYPYPGAQAAGTPAEYAGFWRRVAAFLIDSIILGIGLSILMFITLFVVGPFAVLITVVGQWLYFAIMESSSRQATVGKLALGIIVTDGQGQRISFGRATGRYFGKMISGMILCIGYMLAGWTERKQALHDMMADCLVVCKNPGW